MTRPGRLTAGIALAIGIALAVGLSWAQPASAHLSVVSGIGIAQRPGAQVPSTVELEDSSGRPRRLSSFLGRGPVILVPVTYGCRDLCPIVLSHLARRVARLPYKAGSDFQVVIYSLDPRETPALARLARQRLHARLWGWSFLVGKPAALDRLKAALGLTYRYDPVHREYAHPSVAFVLTPAGRISKTISAIGSPPRTLRLALIAAGQGTIGSPVDQLILTCYHFDPGTGGYVLVALRVMRIAAAGVLLLVVALVGGLLLIERKMRSEGA